MSDLTPVAVRYAKEYKIPTNIFLALGHQESGGSQVGHNGKIVTSPAGAQGWGQLMPATARSLGVDPHDPEQNIKGAAMYLSQQYRQFGSWRLALAAYNAGPGAVRSGKWRSYGETVRYVRNILAHAKEIRGDKPARSSRSSTVTPPPPAASLPSALPLIPGATLPASDGPFGDPVSNQAFTNLGRIARGESPTHTLRDLVDVASQPAPVEAPVAASPLPSQPPNPQPVSPGRTSVPAKGGPLKLGRVSFRAGANRSGVNVHAPVVSFVKRIAGVHGAPLTITTGTNHHQYVSGEGHTQSAHWTGWAVDLAINNNAPGQVDPRVTKLGQDALIAAGMPVAEARRQKGGVFNLNGYQVLFNTTVGGNHYNHVHVGLRPERQHG